MPSTRIAPRARSSAPATPWDRAAGSCSCRRPSAAGSASNPLLHVDNWLGVGTDNIIWGDYETRHYYFPVQFRPGLDRPSADDLERIISRDDPREAAGRAHDWERLLARHAGAIDVLVTYKDDPLLDAVTQRFFGVVESRGDVRILRRDRAREPLQAGSSTTGLADRRER